MTDGVQATTAAPARVKRVVHTIHAVRDIDACRMRYQDVLGGLVFAEGYFEPEDRDMALLYVGDHMVEPMAPRQPDDLGKPYSRYLARYGEGWHSFELRIADCPDVAARLKADGYTLASDYGMFFYVRPESTGGLLLEACDVSIPNDPYDRRNWRPDWAEGHASTVLRLDHIACVLNDAEAARRLFTTYVDGEVLDDRRISAPQPARRVLLRLGGDDVALIQPDDPASGVLADFIRPPTSGVYALVWAVEDLGRAQAFFEEKGLRVTRENCVSGGFAIDPADFQGARHEFVAAS
ncbi:VOC family protein [Blastococcus sp. URHD0036]|uniref:VOC family protein n=1 Tax=Blastococcus sp. URHD0036 TaxID=1380356 RepID=UPI0004962531|nr:VOC family protein [Blastococcus sp. URHD0036]